MNAIAGFPRGGGHARMAHGSPMEAMEKQPVRGQCELSWKNFLLAQNHMATLALSVVLICAVPTATLAAAAGHEASQAQTSASRIARKTRHEAPFLAANAAAMTRMMTDMSVQPSGDIDHDFVAMMVPHHQGAIDMAVAELRYGHNEQLRRLAQEIIVTQQQEIAAMRLAMGDPLPPSKASPTQARRVPDH
jgi:hypothetical protein